MEHVAVALQQDLPPATSTWKTKVSRSLGHALAINRHETKQEGCKVQFFTYAASVPDKALIKHFLAKRTTSPFGWKTQSMSSL